MKLRTKALHFPTRHISVSFLFEVPECVLGLSNAPRSIFDGKRLIMSLVTASFVVAMRFKMSVYVSMQCLEACESRFTRAYRLFQNFDEIQPRSSLVWYFLRFAVHVSNLCIKILLPLSSFDGHI